MSPALDILIRSMRMFPLASSKLEIDDIIDD